MLIIVGALVINLRGNEGIPNNEPGDLTNRPALAELKAEIQEIDTQIEEQIAEAEIEDEPVPVPEEDEELQVANDDFSRAYQQAAGQRGVLDEYELLQELYTQSPSDDLLPHLIDRAVSLRYYDDAVGYMNALLAKNKLFELVPPERFIDILLNVDELNLPVLANIKALVYEYTQAGLLTQQDQNKFYGLIAFAKWDIDNYGFFVENLSGEYLNRKIGYERARDAVFQFEDPPAYYLDGLLALEMFTRGYYTLARLAAQRILDEDPNYVLTHQLLAYTNLYTHKPARAIPHLERLQQADEQNEELYRFLLGIAHYQNDNPGAAVISFRGVDSETYLTDTLRYQLLLYTEIEDEDRLLIATNKLLARPDLTPYDFYTLFLRWYYDADKREFIASVQDRDTDLSAAIQLRCGEVLSSEYSYVCLLGKAWAYLLEGEDERAYRYLELLTRWYPRKVIFQQLGEIAQWMWLKEESKRRHIKWVLTDGQMRSMRDISWEIQAILWAWAE